MPKIPLGLDSDDETDAIWHCPLCHEPSVANEYDGHTLHLRCDNGHEWTWDGTWLQWDVPDENDG